MQNTDTNGSPNNPTARPWFGLGLAAVGGLMAIPSAIFQEGLLADSLTSFTVAPMVEEAVKPIGVYLLLAY